MKLRRATMEDAEILLSWRNDETTRENSFNKGIITLDSHKKWLSSKLNDSRCLLLILEDEDARVGSIRIDIGGKDGEIGEISYSIAPECRGKGYGKKILALAEKEKPASVMIFAGMVKASNVASQKCFEALGYTELSGEDIKCFVKNVR